MRTKKDIQMLLESGLSSAFVAKLNDTQIKSLVNRFSKNVIEEQSIPQNTTVVTKPAQPSYQVNPNSKTMVNGVEVDTTGGKTVVTPLKEKNEMTEKFESKAQQGFFWAKCNTSKGVKKKKWCELAKEFSDKTTKKDYEKMPDHVTEGFYDLFKKKTPNQISDFMPICQNTEVLIIKEPKNFIVNYLRRKKKKPMKNTKNFWRIVLLK